MVIQLSREEIKAIIFQHLQNVHKIAIGDQSDDSSPKMHFVIDSEGRTLKRAEIFINQTEQETTPHDFLQSMYQRYL